MNRTDEITQTIEMYKKMLETCPPEDVESIQSEIDYWETLLNEITGRGL